MERVGIPLKVFLEGQVRSLRMLLMTQFSLLNQLKVKLKIF